MVDVVNGKTRVRAWPRKRGPPTDPAQKERVEKFSQVQRAFRYADSQNAYDIAKARVGTPILPRDLWTSILFGTLAAIETADGKVIWPMSARSSTSTALDTITQTPGQTLVRGAEGWEAAAYAGAMPWTVVADSVISAPVARWESPDLSPFDSLIVLTLGVTASAVSGRGMQLRNSLSGTYPSATNAFSVISAAGALTNAAFLTFSTGTVATALYGMMQIEGLRSTKPCTVARPNRADVALFGGKTSGVDRLRIANGDPGTPVGNLTGGRIVILGR